MRVPSLSCSGCRGWCCSITICDVLKLILPICWTIFAIFAILVYASEPYEYRQWDGLGLAFFSALSTIGLSAFIYRFHTSSSSTTTTSYDSMMIEEGGHVPVQDELYMYYYQRKRSIFLYRFVATSFTSLTVLILIYYSAYAEGFHECSSCVADDIWCAVTLLVNLTWLGLSTLSAKRLESQWTLKSSSATIHDT